MVGALTRIVEQAGELAILLGRTLVAVAAGRIPVGETVRQMQAIGVASIPIAMLTVAFSGAVIALHTTLEFIRYGRQDVVGSVVAITVAREVAPVLTGVLISARVGAAVAAEIGTMAVTEQVDALRALGVSPVHYLVVPRFVAAILMLPVVTLFAGIAGVYGAYLVASGSGIATATFWHSTRAMPMGDLLLGLSKTFFFGMIISLVGCWEGLRTTGGAAGVGRATTASVVLSTVLVYIANYYLAALLFGDQPIRF